MNGLTSFFLLFKTRIGWMPKRALQSLLSYTNLWRLRQSYLSRFIKKYSYLRWGYDIETLKRTRVMCGKNHNKNNCNQLTIFCFMALVHKPFDDPSQISPGLKLWALFCTSVVDCTLAKKWEEKTNLYAWYL